MIVRGKAPLRVSFAGGGTDLNYIFEKYGGAIVNCTIDKFCHMTIEKREDDFIYIDGEDFLAKRVIDFFKPQFGFNLYYHNDIEPGSGLGNSSSFVILFLRLLHEMNNEVVTDTQLVEEAYEIETSIKEGGWQDQYSIAIGGFNFMEFNKKTLIYPLRLKYSFLSELNEHLLLAKVKGEKKEDIHKLVREYHENNINEMEKTVKLKDLAFKMRDCLLNQNIKEVANIIKESWELKKNKYVTNDSIDYLYNLALDNGAESGRLCGSGQAGHFLFFVKPENKSKLIKALKDYQIVNFNFTNHGVETWKGNI